MISVNIMISPDHVALPVASFPEMLTNLSPREQALLPVLDVFSVGWVRELRRGSRDAASEDDPRPNILQLNTEGMTANKISVIEQLAYKNKAFIIVLLRKSKKFK